MTDTNDAFVIAAAERKTFTIGEHRFKTIKPNLRSAVKLRLMAQSIASASTEQQQDPEFLLPKMAELVDADDRDAFCEAMMEELPLDELGTLITGLMALVRGNPTVRTPSSDTAGSGASSLSPDATGSPSSAGAPGTALPTPTN